MSYEVQVTGSQETIADRKMTGSVPMFHCCVVSGRRKQTSIVYISDQPDTYVVASCKNILKISIPATLGPRHSSSMARSKIFPIQGGVQR